MQGDQENLRAPPCSHRERCRVGMLGLDRMHACLRAQRSASCWGGTVTRSNASSSNWSSSASANWNFIFTPALYARERPMGVFVAASVREIPVTSDYSPRSGSVCGGGRGRVQSVDTTVASNLALAIESAGSPAAEATSNTCAPMYGSMILRDCNAEVSRLLWGGWEGVLFVQNLQGELTFCRMIS